MPTSSSEADVLMDRGYFVRDGFLGPALAAEALRLLLQRYASPTPEDSAQPSANGREQRVWLKKDDALHRVFAPPFEDLRHSLTSCLPLDDTVELTAVNYPGDGICSEPHLDAMPSRIFRRRVTALAYFNPHWEASHGGALRLHLPAGLIDVEPTMDRLLVFLSKKVVHEVRPVFAPRFAVAGRFFSKT